jgi:hypothetical protein
VVQRTQHHSQVLLLSSDKKSPQLGGKVPRQRKEYGEQFYCLLRQSEDNRHYSSTGNVTGAFPPPSPTDAGALVPDSEPELTSKVALSGVWNCRGSSPP